MLIRLSFGLIHLTAHKSRAIVPIPFESSMQMNVNKTRGPSPTVPEYSLRLKNEYTPEGVYVHFLTMGFESTLQRLYQEFTFLYKARGQYFPSPPLQAINRDGETVFDEKKILRSRTP